MEQILPEKNFKNIRITTNKIINDFLIWKWGSNSSQMFSKIQIPIQTTQNCAFPQNFCTRKLGKISVFYFECIWWYWMLVSTLHKTPKFHLISLCGNFVERHSFQRVSTDSPKTLRKLCLSTKFLLQKIRWNEIILRSAANFLHSIK